MDFARKQLEKYGWSDGKGLGRHENGIKEALKPTLKRSTAGVGHDASTDFTDHWWSALYDKASNNVEVKNENGKTKKIVTKDPDAVEFSTKTWKINRKHKKEAPNEEGYTEHFVKKAVLTNGGAKTEVLNNSDSESEEEISDVFKTTDEELFAACGGRTAHKGARHGLKATGKLARIQEQEMKLLSQPQFVGYSHMKSVAAKEEVIAKLNSETTEEIIENANISEEESIKSKSKTRKKRKKKYCSRETDETPNTDGIEFVNKNLVDSNCHEEASKNLLKTDNSALGNAQKERTVSNIKRKRKVEEEAKIDGEDDEYKHCIQLSELVNLEDELESEDVAKVKKPRKKKIRKC